MAHDYGIVVNCSHFLFYFTFEFASMHFVQLAKEVAVKIFFFLLFPIAVNLLNTHADAFFSSPIAIAFVSKTFSLYNHFYGLC